MADNDDKTTLGDIIRHPASLAAGVVGGLQGLIHLPTVFASWQSLDLLFSGLYMTTKIGEPGPVVQGLVLVVGGLLAARQFWKFGQRLAGSGDKS